MATCQHCGAFVSLPFKCNYCGLELCPNCRLPFNHNCTGIGLWNARFIPPIFKKADQKTGEYMPPRTPAAYDEEADHRFYPRHENEIPSPHYSRPEPERVSIRRRLQRAYREVAYSVWRFWRYAKKNWFWILCLFVLAYVCLR